MPKQFSLETNQEGEIVLHELAVIVGCSVEQFIDDSIFITALCIKVIEENRAKGKHPTHLLFEDEDGMWLTYDLVDAITHNSTDMLDTLHGSVIDPFETATSIEVPIGLQAREELDRTSTYLGELPRKVLEEAINLRWMLQQASSKSLNVLIESETPDVYFEVPTSLVG